MPRGGPLPKLNDRSGAFPAGAPAVPGAGGGGIFGGPPTVWFDGNGCCCSGGRAFGSFGSTSSHSDDKSPELNLCRNGKEEMKKWQLNFYSFRRAREMDS